MYFFFVSFFFCLLLDSLKLEISEFSQFLSVSEELITWKLWQISKWIETSHLHHNIAVSYIIGESLEFGPQGEILGFQRRLSMTRRMFCM